MSDVPLTEIRCDSLSEPGGVLADSVIVGYTTASGHKDAVVTFGVDSYDWRDATGELDSHIKTCVLPVLRRRWHPIFMEVGRWVRYGEGP